MIKRTLVGLASIVALILSLLILAGPASAHATQISGSATCQKDGTYSISWTGHTDQVPADDTGKVTETSPDSQVITSNLAPNADYSFTSTAPGDSKGQDASVHVDWTGGDTFSADASGHVDLDGLCKTPPVSSPPVSSPPVSSPPVSPPVSSSPPASSTPPVVVPPKSSTPPVKTTSPPKSSSSIAPPVSTQRPAKKVSISKASKSTPLASTGSKTGLLITLAVVLLLFGAGAMYFGRRKPTHGAQ